jgi:hypothetical protein
MDRLRKQGFASASFAEQYDGDVGSGGERGQL